MFAINDKLSLADGTYRVGLDKTRLVYTADRVMGYWVASTNLVAPTPEHVGRVVESLVRDHDAEYVGIWTSSLGRVFVDSTHHLKTRDFALEQARKWGQQAIWDCANDCLMDVN